MFQVSGLVQIFLQTAAAGVLPAELSVILVVGNGNAEWHGNGNARNGNVAWEQCKHGSCEEYPAGGEPFTRTSH